MKTIKSITIIILTILISYSSLAINYHENELNKNPDTERKLLAFDFEEEEYIKDIPFDTWQIANGALKDRKRSNNHNNKRPIFIGLQPGYTAEQFYDEGELDINIIPITFQIPIGKLTDFRVTTLANYHLGGEQNGFADVGLQVVVPVYFKKKENGKDLPRGFYAGPMVGFSRNLINEHYTTNLAAEAGYQFPTSKSFSISMGLQLGATYFTYDDQPNVWRNHFGFKVNIGFWVNQGK